MLDKKSELSKAKRDGTKSFKQTLGLFMAKLNAFVPMRAFKQYSQHHGPVMAAGSAYNMFFSVAALLVAGFSVFGLIAAGDTALQDKVVSTVSKTVPNLIDTGQGGLATKDDLFKKAADGYSLTLIISILTGLVTSLGWINGLREGMRGVFGLPPVVASPVMVKLKDLGTLLLLGVALLLTTAIGAVFSATTQTIMDFLHLESGFAGFMVQAVGFLVMLVLDTVVAGILFRMASGIIMPKKALLTAALVAGIGSTVLRLFSAQLIGGVANKPLLAPFAVILGLFVWFFFLSQVYLYATALGCVLTSDEESRQDAYVSPHKPSLRRRSRTGRLAAHQA